MKISNHQSSIRQAGQVKLAAGQVSETSQERTTGQGKNFEMGNTKD